MSEAIESTTQSLKEKAKEFIDDKATPRWIKDLFRFLPVKSQFLLSSNVRDYYPFRIEKDRYQPCNILQYMAKSLQLKEYEYFVSFNRLQYFSILTPSPGEMDNAQKFFREKFGIENNKECSLKKSLDLIEKIIGWKENFIAVFADFASRYLIRTDSLSENEHDYFTKAQILSYKAECHIAQNSELPKYNPIIWICDKENDFPGWFVMENPKIRSIVLPKPDHILRGALIRSLTPELEGFDKASGKEQEESHDTFVGQTEGMLITDVIAITQLCMHENLPFTQIGEAVRRYKIGVTEDPWTRIESKKIINGEQMIRKRVKGQQAAVTKSLDIIKRAMTRLSGAQGSKIGGKPRGVMFLAGPTGTGKTELAKTITELLFDDERAMIRFDMSEFSQEHTDQRLIGAPPGYIGSDMGGELTNAIKEKPFSVVLFDEIEKAHPRILDKFLQVLDDGVLTSGRGERVYFSESVIVFTSNLGISRIENGERILNVTADNTYAEVEHRVRMEIENYFKLQIGRPEILNRIGENIVIFDFIRKDVAMQIYDKMIMGILNRLKDGQNIEVVVENNVINDLRTKCISDLSNGGRGIGNQLEAWLINPLARAMFDSDIKEGSRIRIIALEEINGIPQVKIEQI